MAALVGCGGKVDDAVGSAPPAPVFSPPPSGSMPGGRDRTPRGRPAAIPMEVPVEDPETENQTASVEEIMRDLLDGLCGSCHGAEAIREGNVQGGFDFVTDMDRMVEEGWVVPLSSEYSLLVQVMRNGSMPPPGVEPRPTRNDIQIVAQFIDNPLFWDVPEEPPTAIDAGSPDVVADAGTDAD